MSVSRYLKEFDELNTTTYSIFNLEDNNVLIVLKDGTNLTDFNDVDDKDEIIYISEDLSDFTDLTEKYKDFKSLRAIVALGLTDKVTAAKGMFYGCRSLVDISTLKDWDVRNIAHMDDMFDGCSSLDDISALRKWDVGNVTNMKAMFWGCRNLADVSALKGWNVSCVTNMWSMFSNCENLEDISALGDWDVSSLKNMRAMFVNCTSLKDLSGLKNWNVGNVENMRAAFYNCTSLKDLSPLEGWDVSKAESMRAMFYNCSSLAGLQGLEGWDVANVRHMEEMFYNCGDLVDVSALGGWDVSNVENMEEMFHNCGSLADISGLNAWNVSDATNTDDMFSSCDSIEACPDWNDKRGSDSKNNASHKKGSHKLKSPFRAYNGDEPYIFISYKHNDADMVYPVIKQFNDHGFNIWYDEGLPYGENFDIIIPEKIENSALFVNFITNECMACASNSEDYMIKESDIAQYLEKPIVAIYLEADVKLKGYYLTNYLKKQSLYRQEYGDNEDVFIKDCTNVFIDKGIEPKPVVEEKPAGFKNADDEGKFFRRNVSWKYASLYVAGSFIDMHAERDYLIKEVLPELSMWCEDRKITLAGADLRWGIANNESYNKNTIDRVLGIVDDCRPFFLSFVGQRRGWVPDFSQDINLHDCRYENIRDFEGLSATEMEIEHAIHPLKLIDSGISYPPAAHCLFFFRNPEYTNYITDYQRMIYANDDLIDADAIRAADDRLLELKDRIILEKYAQDNMLDGIDISINDYECDWNPNLICHELDDGYYNRNNEHLGRLTNFTCQGESLRDVIISQMKERLMAAFPENRDIYSDSPLEKEIMLHDKFCALYGILNFVRPADIEFLNDFLQSNDKFCLVSAQSSYYHSLLLSNFAMHAERNHGIYVYKRFCGTSDLSSDIYFLWKSIIDEAGISENEDFYPKTPKELKRNISKILNAIAGNGKSLIIIDSLHRLDYGTDFVRLLKRIPDNLKIVISIKKDESNVKYNKMVNILEQRNMPILKMSNFESDEDKVFFIKKFLKGYLKTLNDEDIELICGLKASSNPLFLKIMLSELVFFGSYNNLSSEIQKFGDDPKSAFNHVLERLEMDERAIMGSDEMVPLMFSILANSYDELEEDSFVPLIQSQIDLPADEIIDSIRRIFGQLSQFIICMDGTYDFFYESFKLAALERYSEYTDLWIQLSEEDSQLGDLILDILDIY